MAILVGSGPGLRAQETEEKAEVVRSSPQALAIYAEAAGFQNSKQFDLALAEWTRFLKDHADDPRALEARYNLAVCQIQEQKFQAASTELTQVVKDAEPDFKRLQDAYLNLGWAQYSQAQGNQPKLYAQASATFATLLKKFPESQFRDQALFFGGESLYLQQKYAEAIKLYRQLVKDHEDSKLHSDGLYALGVALEDKQEFTEAGEVYDRFLKTYATHTLANEVRMRKAETVLQAGDFSTAAQMFGDVAAAEGFRAEDHARYRQAYCIAQLGKFAEAATLFGRLAEELPNSAYAADAAIAAGRAFYRAEKFPEAGRWFEQIIQAKGPHTPEAAHWQARILLDQKQPAEARTLLGPIIASAQADPFYVNLLLDDADAQYEIPETRQASVAAYLAIAEQHADHALAAKALYNAAYGAMELGDYPQSLKLAQQFTDRYAEHALRTEVRKVVAECKLQLGELDAAAKEFQELASGSEEERTKFELRRGLSLFLNKQYEPAIQLLEQVLEKTQLAEEQAEAAYWLGRSLIALKRYEPAIKALERSRAAGPNWKQADEVLLHLAISQRRVNQLTEAVATLRTLLQTFPESGSLDQAHYRLAEFSYAQSDYATAKQHYSQVLDTWPESKLAPYSLYGRGWSQLRSGQAEAAGEDFATLRTRFTSHPLASQALYAQGMAAHQQGSHQAALARVQEYLKTNPDANGTADGLYLQGLSQVGLQDFAAAVQTFNQLLEKQPEYGSRDKVLYELAWAYKNQGEADQALASFARLADEIPESALAAEAHYHVGEQHYAAKRYAEALTRYEQTIAKASTRDLREKGTYKLGWANYQLEQYDKALQAFDQQLKVEAASGLSADALFMRGECLFKQAKHKEALAAYEKARAQPSQNETMQVLTLLHAGQAAAQLEQWQQSAKLIAQLRQKFPESAYIPQANYERGWAQRNLGDLDGALESFRLVTSVSRNELGARARFMTGEVYFDKKDYPTAILEFRKVMFGFGGEKAPEAIKQWQSKAAFEAGRCATVLAGQADNSDRRAKLIEDARTFFSYVTKKHSKTDEAKEAQKQLDRLRPTGSVSRRTTGGGR